jgi:hypothetical protein
VTDSERLIELIGGPADGRVMRWKHGDYPLLQVPVQGPDGLSFCTYARDPANGGRYLYQDTQKA